ncbi:hypothetical protein ACTMTJ_38950 [Phytohabitans sp. LJ34]|uniref:hypothetical protein n=1 Tax=Phytohabitans sp. LJ34 TaxID=3452217 RepID=UPI003F89D6BB
MVFGQGFVVAHGAPAAVDPGKGPLGHPSAWQDLAEVSRLNDTDGLLELLFLIDGANKSSQP